MSRRSRMTVEVLLRIPLPAGLKVSSIPLNLRRAMQLRKDECENGEPFKSLSIEGVVIKVAKRETVYL